MNVMKLITLMLVIFSFSACQKKIEKKETANLQFLTEIADGIKYPLKESELKFDMTGGPGEYEINLPIDAKRMNFPTGSHIRCKIVGSLNHPDALFVNIISNDRMEAYLVSFNDKLLTESYGYRWQKLSNRILFLKGRE